MKKLRLQAVAVWLMGTYCGGKVASILIKCCHILTIYTGTSVAEPEPVEPKLFETWSRNRSKKYFFIEYLLRSVWRMLG